MRTSYPIVRDVPVDQADTHREQVTHQASHTYNLRPRHYFFFPNLQVRLLRLLTLLVTFVGGLLAITPIHLKPGALTNHLDEINLIGEVLIVQYPYTPLLNTTPTMKVVSETLFNFSESVNPTRIRENKANPSSHAKKILNLLWDEITPSSQVRDVLNLLWDRLVFLQGKIDQGNTDYSLHPLHSRVKRGLLNIFRSASKYLFGTASEDDIHDLKEHYNHVLSYAAHNRRVINLNYRKTGILQSHMNKLLEATNKLAKVMNKALQRLGLLIDFLLMDHTLHVIDAILTSVLSVNDEIIVNMTDAAHRRVTPSVSTARFS